MSDAQLLNALLREDFAAFVEKAFETVSPGNAYVHNWHIEAIAHELARCCNGDTSRLLITQPPRSLKSICASVAFPAWLLGHNPAAEIICVSYSQDLAEELARQFRLVVNSAWYSAAFPKMRLKKDSGNECITTAGGKRVATSIGGTLTGRGADLIIIDDPMKAEEALSETARRRVMSWYSETLTTRLNDKNNGAIVVVMQRLHEDDLAGQVLPSGQWRHLDLPAIAINDERVEIAPGRFHERKAGEALQVEREGLEALARIKAELGSLAFSAQYQQSPVPAEGNLVKRAWFGVYDAMPDESSLRIVQSWDIATSTKDTADYSVCVTAAILRKKVFVLDVFRARLPYPDLKRKIITHAVETNAQTLLIEKAGPGEHLLQELRHDVTPGFATPMGVRPEAEKLVRMEASTWKIENGDVYLPENAPWLGVFLNEILAFPHGKHDDQVDAFSQLLKWVRDQETNQTPTPAGGIVWTRAPGESFH